MEHASDAIIMAGAILIFVIALSTAMMVFSQARATVDTVIYTSDETNFYEYLGDTSNNTTTIKSRTVGWETVIPTLYKYYKENYTVVFLNSNGNGAHLYETQTNEKLWTGATESYTPPIVTKYPGMIGTYSKIICSFDVDEETRRHEPWTGSTEDYKTHLDAFLKGEDFNYPSSGAIAYDYKQGGTNNSKNEGGFINRINTLYGGNDPKFIETIGEYRSDGATKDSIGSTRWDLDEGVRNKKLKRVIVYQLQGKNLT